MAKYYALVSGLPNVTVDTPKPPFSTEAFYEELLPILTKRDRSYLEILRLEPLNKEVLGWIAEGRLTPVEVEEESQEISYGPVETEPTREELFVGLLQQVARAADAGKKSPRVKELPTYIVRFVYDLFYRKAVATDFAEESDQRPSRFEEIGADRLLLEDLLTGYYYDSVGAVGSDFLREWFSLNKNIRNILAVFTCRRLGWDASRYIVGEGEVEQHLLHSKAKDFDLGEFLPYLPKVIQIAEERDIARRERLIDLLKWQWMDDWTFVRIFDIDNVLCYYLRLSILERWSQLDEKTGEATFRKIVLSLKGESANVLQEFKKAQKR